MRRGGRCSAGQGTGRPMAGGVGHVAGSGCSLTPRRAFLTVAVTASSARGRRIMRKRPMQCRFALRAGLGRQRNA